MTGHPQQPVSPAVSRDALRLYAAGIARDIRRHGHWRTDTGDGIDEIWFDGRGKACLAMCPTNEHELDFDALDAALAAALGCDDTDAFEDEHSTEELLARLDSIATVP